LEGWPKFFYRKAARWGEKKQATELWRLKKSLLLNGAEERKRGSQGRGKTKGKARFSLGGERL